MSAKRKKESDQPELPIEGALPTPREKKSAAANGNGATHVLAEDVPAAMAQIPFDPKKSSGRFASPGGPRAFSNTPATSSATAPFRISPTA
jgi:hypothetical protein